METLESLNRFTEEYPQIRDKRLQYSFLGGTAVRLAQESINWKDKRPITDFDLLVFEGGPYPTHQCSTDNVFGVISSTPDEIKKYITSTKIRNKEYFFMNGTFLALTKTCAIDNPRDKDYKDVELLNRINLIDFGALDKLYEKAERLTKKPKVPINTLKWILEGDNGINSKLFQTFPRLVNLLAEFKNLEKAEEVVLSYVQKDIEKDGYALSSVIYDTHSLIREYKDLPEEEKLGTLAMILSIARKNDFIDFDRIIHMDLVPKSRRYTTLNQKRSLLERIEEDYSKNNPSAKFVEESSLNQNIFISN